MRGENDTAIMQHATLEENIQLIRNVLKTQNQLIREIINRMSGRCRGRSFSSQKPKSSFTAARKRQA